MDCQFAVCRMKRAVFSLLVLIEKVCFEKSWLLDGTLTPNHHLPPPRSFILASFLTSISQPFLFNSFIFIWWWRYFIFSSSHHGVKCFFYVCVPLKDSLFFLLFCRKCCFCEWRADRWRDWEGTDRGTAREMENRGADIIYVNKRKILSVNPCDCLMDCTGQNIKAFAPVASSKDITEKQKRK